MQSREDITKNELQEVESDQESTVFFTGDYVEVITQNRTCKTINKIRKIGRNAYVNTETGEYYESIMLGYYEKQGVFFFTAAGGAAGYDVTYYKMTDDGCEQMDYYSEYAGDVPDENGNMKVVRLLNDVDVSEEEHQALLDRYASEYGQATRIDSDAGFLLTKANILAHCQ